MFCLTCLTLIIYFAILALFIPNQRHFLLEAIKCFWNKLTFKHCTDYFDEIIHKRFVMWLSEKKLNRLTSFFVNKKHFDIVISLLGLAFMLVNILLFYILVYFLKNPCNTEETCIIK